MGRHRTWFRVAGDLDSGLDPLLCLHGGPGSTHHYFAPLERLTEDGLAVVLYGQLGCGRSDGPPGIECEWTLAGALRGWDVRPRLPELDLPALVRVSTGAVARERARSLASFKGRRRI